MSKYLEGTDVLGAIASVRMPTVFRPTAPLPRPTAVAPPKPSPTMTIIPTRPLVLTKSSTTPKKGMDPTVAAQKKAAARAEVSKAAQRLQRAAQRLMRKHPQAASALMAAAQKVMARSTSIKGLAEDIEEEFSAMVGAGPTGDLMYQGILDPAIVMQALSDLNGLSTSTNALALAGELLAQVDQGLAQLLNMATPPKDLLDQGNQLQIALNTMTTSGVADPTQVASLQTQVSSWTAYVQAAATGQAPPPPDVSNVTLPLVNPSVLPGISSPSDLPPPGEPPPQGTLPTVTPTVTPPPSSPFDTSPTPSAPMPSSYPADGGLPYGGGGDGGGGGGGGGYFPDDYGQADYGAEGGGGYAEEDLTLPDEMMPEDGSDQGLDEEEQGDDSDLVGMQIVRELLGADTIPSAGQTYADHDTVLAVQQALLAQHFDLGTTGPNHDGVDGTFGPKTAAAIKRMQALVGAPQTGVIDSGVLMALKVPAPPGGPGRVEASATQMAVDHALASDSASSVESAADNVDTLAKTMQPPPPKDVQDKIADAKVKAKTAKTPTEVKEAKAAVVDAAKDLHSSNTFWGKPLWQDAPLKRWQGVVGGLGLAAVVTGLFMAVRR